MSTEPEWYTQFDAPARAYLDLMGHNDTFVRIYFQTVVFRWDNILNALFKDDLS